MVQVLLPLVTHTDACLALVVSCKATRSAWIAQYPRYCRTCTGFGGRAILNYPNEPDDFLACPDCLERGICPRCGAADANPDAPLDGKPICQVCGWSYDDSLPFVAECYCVDPDELDPLGDLEDLPF